MKEVKPEKESGEMQKTAPSLSESTVSKDRPEDADRAVFCVWCSQVLYRYNAPPPAEDEAAACLAAARNHEPCEKNPIHEWITAARDSERERILKIVGVCTCGSGPEFRPMNQRFHSANCSIHIATLIRATAQPDDDLKIQNVESQVSVSALPESSSGSESSGSSLDVQEKLVEALEAIRDSPHCSYESSVHGASGPYVTGVADGHRCAANIAREALSLLNGEVK